ncbi:MAG TPA: hypothetical protein VI895_09755 [Bdellovibrionota bacterium]|nr:hypothetical protein [Bdellovibrionota bacterium]
MFIPKIIDKERDQWRQPRPLELPLQEFPMPPRPALQEEKKAPERGVWIVDI